MTIILTIYYRVYVRFYDLGNRQEVVLGIGVLMFLILKRLNVSVALGYRGFRILEAVFCCVIVFSPL